jgi:hypothetical protein
LWVVGMYVVSFSLNGGKLAIASTMCNMLADDGTLVFAFQLLKLYSASGYCIAYSVLH